jgi:hypothetical protein
MAQQTTRRKELGQQRQSSRRGEQRKPSPSRPAWGQASRDEERRDLDLIRDDLRAPRDESRLG